jgi:hypothetical protein
MDESDARVFRERAVQARLGAKEATRSDFRAIFERLAASYDEKARKAEWRKPQDQPNHVEQ